MPNERAMIVEDVLDGFQGASAVALVIAVVVLFFWLLELVLAAL
jgi:hypothetical protein